MFFFIRMDCSLGPETGNYAEWSGVTLEDEAESLCLGGLKTPGHMSTLAAWAGC